MLDKLGRYGSLGVCDMCMAPSTVGYYVAVLNQWLCEGCYKDFVRTVDRYDEDKGFEKRNFDRFMKLFDVREVA